MLTDGEVKALFSQLVKAVGGQEAAAIYLGGISRQRVQQICSPNCTDMPTFRQIMALELAAERALITTAAKGAIEGGCPSCIRPVIVEAVIGSAALLSAVETMDVDGRRDLAEIQTVQRAAEKNLDADQRAMLAAASLHSGASG
ncbi:MAG: hypothetical protein ACYDD1_19850 [Caulobacteraceae bacterium]